MHTFIIVPTEKYNIFWAHKFENNMIW